MKTQKRLIVYVDVDDTLVRSAGTKTIPIPNVVEQVTQLAGAGAELYRWSTAGAEYARSPAQKLGIDRCFVGFLPKPNILIDDQAICDWKRFATIHPLNTSNKSVDDYWSLIDDTNWKQELEEVSAGCYRITVTDPAGCLRYSATDTDPQTLTKAAKEWLSALGTQGTLPTP